MVFEPLPEVDRVVFIATPHRGSFRASGWIQGLMRRLIHLPSTLVDQSQSTLAQVGMTHLPTSIDNMSPNNHMVRTLADSPVDPRIKAHSIVAVKNPGGLPGQTDGVVAYESAHIGSVESELVVRSFHSVQGHPDAIEEVRRILRENLGKDLTPTK
jgi:hypothetical protein